MRQISFKQLKSIPNWLFLILLMTVLAACNLNSAMTSNEDTGAVQNGQSDSQENGTLVIPVIESSTPVPSPGQV